MIHLDHISFGYNSKPLIKDFSLSLEAGDLYRIKGRNGAGKSTLLSIMAGLLTPTAGHLKLDESQESGFIEYLSAENNALLHSQNLNDNLNFWRSLAGRSANKALLDSIKQRWNINSNQFIDTLPVEKFSTGMKRRLALARVEYSQRPCWLLDEPTFGLDQDGQETLCDVMRQHIDNKGIIVLVTHNDKWLQDLKAKTVNL